LKEIKKYNIVVEYRGIMFKVLWKLNSWSKVEMCDHIYFTERQYANNFIINNNVSSVQIIVLNKAGRWS